MRLSRSQVWITLAMNSGPLSLRIYLGGPCRAMASCNSSEHIRSLDRTICLNAVALTGVFVDQVERSQLAARDFNLDHRMEFTFTCALCERALPEATEYSGRQIQCPDCR